VRLREIQLSKFTMINLGSLIVCLGCLFFGNKTSDVDRSIIHCNSASPFTQFWSPKYSSITTVANRLTIAAILLVSALPKVLFSIVQRVVIYMISKFIFFKVKYLSVHRNASILRLSFGVKTFSLGVPISTPVPLRYTLKIFSVNNGVLALRKRNKAVGLVERLSYCVSFHAVFVHRFTSNGPLRSVAILS
jgi:hypothetical protein